jgi:hypothetical protein
MSSIACSDGPLPENLDKIWAEFFSQERSINDLFAHPILFPLQRPREMVEMVRVASEIRPRVLLDIGSDKGGGLWAWLKFLPTLEAVIACEIRGLPYQKQFELAFPKVDFLWLPYSSYKNDTITAVEDWLAIREPSSSIFKIDVAFLDGDKSWFHKDFEAYKPLMHTDAVVVFHDIQDPAPRSSFELCRSRGTTSSTFIDVDDYTHLSGREPKTEHDNWLLHWQGRSCGLGIIHL